MENEIKKRFTAFKLPISMLLKGIPKFEKNPEGTEKFNFLSVEDKEINRVNLIATVIDKYQSEQTNYSVLTVDDGTGDIRVKEFSNSTEILKEIQLGDTVLIIGLLRYYNEELYIQPEIIKRVDARWLLARKLELEKNFKINYDEIISKDTWQNKEIKIEKISEEHLEQPSLREEILQIISDAEVQEGIDIDEIILRLKQPVDEIRAVITDLIEAGEIFEPRPGRLRIL